MSATTHHRPDSNATFVDALLAEQRQFTAVDQFARAHERDELPANARHYRNLLPAAAPGPGQQYAFEVDLDKCSGCKACVTACHSLNGLDDDESWRDVGALASEDWRQPFTQTVTTACHHCVDPGCLNGCPVLAYEKDATTGIVRHLDDQCIGCQYCILKCPYEVPKYSERRGIVRKCDMCSQRLAVGEAPACVQACPNEAIRITLVATAEVSAQYRSGVMESWSDGESESVQQSNTPARRAGFLPASPDPRITLPTTRYVSQRGLPSDLRAGDEGVVSPSPAHWPLVFLLVLTQLAVGATLAALIVQPALPLMIAALAAGAAGLGIGALHLGQPLKAWRAFLGWRKSWFSREVIVFGAFMPLLAMVAALLWFKPAIDFEGKLLIAVPAAAGVLGVFCSAMIYADTRREFWSATQSLVKFFGTTLLLGSAMALVFTGRPVFAVMLVVSSAAKLAIEHRIFRHLRDAETSGLSPLSKTARLLVGELGLCARLRVACGFLGGVIVPVLFLLAPTPLLAGAALLSCVAGELLERYLFFTAVVTRKMPGSPAA